MTTAVDRYLVSVLRFDADTVGRIQQVMMQLQQSMGGEAKTSFSPHISLVPTDFEKRDDLGDGFSEWLSLQQAFDITFSHVGVFGGDILFLGVTVTESLLAFHQACFHRMSPSSNAPWIDLYKPGRWVPHCTLATGVPEHELGPAIVAATTALMLPLTAVCQVVDLVSVEGEHSEVIASVSLRTS